MRILHTSDWHLGRTLHGVDLLDHQAAYLDHLVEVVRETRVDAVLVAGDVYDRAVPPVPAVELLADALGRLAAHTRVVLTPGNHDSATRLGFGARLFTERVSVRCRIADIARPVEIPDADGRTGVLVYAVPYLDPDSARHQLADRDRVGADDDGADDDGAAVPLVPGRSHEAVLSAAMGRVRRDLAVHRGGSGSRVPAVVMAHAFVVGGQASESERDIRVGGVDSVPAGIFRPVGRDEAAPGGASPDGTAGVDVDYVALGHLHGAQRIGSDDRGPVLRYAGSPLAYSFSERSQRKSSTVVELVDDGV
ncbi:MAG TPA: exonuclease subunit SbcD, partial [Actinotalea sp.]|nr:exonuclease subunit SbcD [Actinotalea sp.]